MGTTSLRASSWKTIFPPIWQWMPIREKKKKVFAPLTCYSSISTYFFRRKKNVITLTCSQKRKSLFILYSSCDERLFSHNEWKKRQRPQLCLKGFFFIVCPGKTILQPEAKSQIIISAWLTSNHKVLSEKRELPTFCEL